MTDFRTMYDRDFIFHYDLGGRDVTVTIDHVKQGELTGTGGKKSKKPVVYFEGKDRGLAICKTNGNTIASLYGADVREWKGKRITLYPTKTMFGGKEVDCIRIRPTPGGNAERKQQGARPPEESE
jgi:hypothetical protein